jgi:hypothetical protein
MCFYGLDYLLGKIEYMYRPRITYFYVKTIDRKITTPTLATQFDYVILNQHDTCSLFQYNYVVKYD